jgi:hypothetical protein
MLIFVAAALAAGAPQSGLTATAQATATIRVLRAVTLKLDGSPNADAPPPRDTVVTMADGTRQPTKVIDFQ